MRPACADKRKEEVEKVIVVYRSPTFLSSFIAGCAVQVRSPLEILRNNRDRQADGTACRSVLFLSGLYRREESDKALFPQQWDEWMN
jgi:hypothetical protein